MSAVIGARRLGDLLEADLIATLPDLSDWFVPYRWRDPARLSADRIAELDRLYCEACDLSFACGGQGCRRHRPRPGRPWGQRRAQVSRAPGPPPSFACGEIAEWNGEEVTVEMVCASGNAVVRTPDGLRTAPVAELHRSERPADAAAT